MHAMEVKCIHARTHACMHTCNYMHTCMHAYIYTCMYMRTCIHTRIHSYIHCIVIHIYIHTHVLNILTYRPTYIHIHPTLISGFAAAVSLSIQIHMQLCPKLFGLPPPPTHTHTPPPPPPPPTTNPVYGPVERIQHSMLGAVCQ